MVSNVIKIVKATLKSCTKRSITRLTDSIIDFHLLNRQGFYKQFVANRGTKILEKDYIKWCYAPTKQNSADIGSRGSLLN